MINVQLKHVEFNNAIINEHCSRYLDLAGNDGNPQRPDRFWIMHTLDSTPGVFTYGTKQSHDSSNIPKSINGIEVVPQIRTGEITYHGPGQIGWIGVMNYRRFVRQNPEFNLEELMHEFCISINEEFHETLIYNPDDPGIYRTTGEKVLSLGVDLPGITWMALKIGLNLHVDLNVYNNATICGISNRSVGNLLTYMPDQDEQQRLGISILQRFLARIYHQHRIVPWTD